MPMALLRGMVFPFPSVLLFVFTAIHLYKPSGSGGLLSPLFSFQTDENFSLADEA